MADGPPAREAGQGPPAREAGQGPPARGPVGAGSLGGAAVAGILAGSVALAVSELVVRLVPRPSLVLSVGEVVIRRVPPSVEDAAIGAFGTSDKTVLVLGVLAVSLAVAAVLGMVARRRFWWGAAGFGLFGVAGAAAGVSRSSISPAGAVVGAAVGVAAGLAVLHRLVVAEPGLRGPNAEPGLRGPNAEPGLGGPNAEPGLRGPNAERGPGRREVLRLAAWGVGAAVAAGAVGRLVVRRGLGAGTAPGEVSLPTPATPLASPAPGASLAVDGLSPLVTPNGRFYRIDTALTVPRVDIDGWRLRITGMVDRPVALTWDDLASMPQTEADVTLSCVSNEVGGDLVGNARWQGVRLSDLLDRAGVRPGATQVVGRSLDGWTGGFPTELALDGRPALVAVGMNGAPLPLAHGFPARLVVAGLYGYVSATKWLSEIRLTTLDGYDGYWVPRGWSKLGPVKTQSRIDVPRARQTIAAGPQVVAGVAWAPHRGIRGVEVSIDDGPWAEATLADALGSDSWRQWRYGWEASPGSHTIRVRATDGTGATQVAERSSPRPDGATGYHTIRVDVA